MERVRSQWDSTQHGVEARLLQLDNMTGHSNQWEEHRKEVTALVGHTDGHFQKLLQRSRDPLTKQFEDSKVRETFHSFYLVTLIFFRSVRLCLNGWITSVRKLFTKSQILDGLLSALLFNPCAIL